MDADFWVALALGSAITVVVAVIAHVRSNRRPGLIYMITSGVVIEGNPAREIGVTYKGEPVERLSRTLVLIGNMGKAPLTSHQIAPKDPIMIRLAGDTRILSTEVDDEGGIHGVSVHDGPEENDVKSLVVGFDYLNPGDNFRIFITHTGEQPTSVEPSGTIIGGMRQVVFHLKPTKRTGFLEV